MSSPSSRFAWSRFARASTATTNLVVGGAAAVGAAALHSLPVLALGAVAYSALVAWDLVSGKKVDPAAPARVRVGTTRIDPLSVSDGATRATLQVIVTAHASIDRVVADAPTEVHQQLEPTLCSIAELEERAAYLAKRGEALARYLQTTDPASLQQDCDNLVAWVKQATDEATRHQLERALEARRQHLDVVLDLGRTKQRIDATLLGIASTLDGLSARIVRASGEETQGMIGDDVGQELARMNIEIGTFEETLKTLAEIDV